MNNIVFLLYFLVLGFTFSIYAQNKGSIYINGKKIDLQTYLNNIKYHNQPPTLTMQEMYEDFDTLISFIEKCNPQSAVIKEVTKYDMIHDMKLLRNSIASINNTFDFINLLKQILSMSIDGHHFIANSMFTFRNHYKKDIELNHITDREIGIMLWYRDSIFYKNPPELEMLYIDGDYYLKYTTLFDNTIIPEGAKIIKYNDISIESFQNSIKKWNSQWDFDKKRYYHTKLSLEQKENRMVFDIAGKITPCIFQHISQSEKEPFVPEKFAVQWIKHDSILYIRLPEMFDDEQNISRFHKNILQYKAQSIKGIIVDIRNNVGGNDRCWISLLERIFSDTLSFQQCLVMQNDANIKQRYELQNAEKNYGFATFSVLEEEIIKIEPKKENLNYKGTLYLLKDENVFSSANAFASLGSKTKKIETIGVATGRIGGRGATPNIFLLPHSRFCFFLELALDASHVSQASDFYQDKINHKIAPSLNYYHWYNNLDRRKTVKIKERYKYDDFFLKAVDIIKK